MLTFLPQGWKSTRRWPGQKDRHPANNPPILFSLTQCLPCCPLRKCVKSAVELAAPAAASLRWHQATAHTRQVLARLNTEPFGCGACVFWETPCAIGVSTLKTI
jgi:hypothetical protein